MRDEIARWVGILAVAASLACDASLGSVATDSETGTTNTGDGDGDGDGPMPTNERPPCIGGSLCPEGTSCSNGVCEIECDADEDCGDDGFFCGLDGLCHPKVIPTCNSDQDCEPTQACVDQLCMATADGPCNPNNLLIDGCPSNAVCDYDPDELEGGLCHEMPACQPDQTCPVGTVGAICNTGQIPSKDEICLIGWCDVVSDCPELWTCVRFENAVLGLCSSGGFGSPCTNNGHCLSGTCLLLPGTGGGFCT